MKLERKQLIHCNFAGAVLAAGTGIVLLSSPQSRAAAAVDNDPLAEVVVTGSLISDPNHVAPSPIVITSSEDLRQAAECRSRRR